MHRFWDNWLQKCRHLENRVRDFSKSLEMTPFDRVYTIPQGVSFHRMREIAHQNVYSASFFVRVLPTAYSLGPWTDFHA